MTRIFAFLVILFFSNVLFAKVDINRASAEELAAELDGVGEKKAIAIVAYRTQHGKFKSIEELIMVKGIGQKIVEKNKTLIVFGDEPEK